MNSDKILEKVVSTFIGERAVPIVFYLKDNEEVSELDIAQDLSIEVHEVRTLLYGLSEKSLVNFKKKKDPKRGWYVSFWSLEPENVALLYRRYIDQRTAELKERIRKEECTRFYICESACTRADFASATSLNYMCPECGKLMEPHDNDATISFLKQQLAGLKKKL